MINNVNKLLVANAFEPEESNNKRDIFEQVREIAPDFISLSMIRYKKNWVSISANTPKIHNIISFLNLLEQYGFNEIELKKIKYMVSNVKFSVIFKTTN